MAASKFHTKYRRYTALISGVSFLFSAFFLLFFSFSLPATAQAEEFSVEKSQVVDCLLPGKVRKLGMRRKFISKRRPIKATALECEIRGGEYTAYDRANMTTSLMVWLESANSGDAKAQYYVGEIYEKGYGQQPDYRQAALWYTKSAEQGYKPAQMALGLLYEKGKGVPQDTVAAMDWYQRAEGLQAGQSAYIDAVNNMKNQIYAGGGSRMLSISVHWPNMRPEGRGSRSADVFAGTSVAITGNVSPVQLLRNFTINGQNWTVDRHGVFTYSVDVGTSPLPINLKAYAGNGQAVEYSFTLQPSDGSSTEQYEQSIPVGNRAAYGKYYALVIGNNNYNARSGVPVLQTAVNDADSVARILQNKYGCEVTLLRNITSVDFFKAMTYLRQRVGKNDNLIIYYAGHGFYDEYENRGYWLPVDADKSNHIRWISNSAITAQILTMDVRNVLIIADSCYAASLTRSVMGTMNSTIPSAQQEYRRRNNIERPTRMVLTSGGLQQVLDVLKGSNSNHSIFTQALIEVLQNHKSNTELNGDTLHRKVAHKVAIAMENAIKNEQVSKEMIQIPTYAPLLRGGHKGGEFYLLAH